MLYSCDFSRKPSTQSEVVLTLDNLTSLGRGRRASQARVRLEAARKSLEDKQEAKRAVEAALQLSAPIKDDLSLAEELSKCEGLMTRTGLKRVAATENSGSGSVVLSIPLAKTKKSDTGSKKGAVKKPSPSKLQQESASKTAENKNERTLPLIKQEPKQESNRNKTQSSALGSVSLTSSNKKEHSNREEKSSREETSTETELMDTGQTVTGVEVPAEHSVPCGCSKSPSSVVGSGGKGWEGTATLSHGSRLRFGCLQFVLSLAGQPGHSELLQALDEQLGSQQEDS